MPDINVIGVVILIALFLLWKLDFIARVLNLKAFGNGIPPELEDTLDQETHDRAREYATAGARLSTLESTASLTLLLGFWLLGGFGWLDGLARSLAGDGIFGGLLFLGSLFVANHLVMLPFRIYDTFRLEARFGFNQTTPATFVTDEIKGLLLAALIGLPLGAAVLWIFHTVPNAWLWAWILFTAFQLALTYIAPTWILPLFNRFDPMPDGPTRQAIEDLARRCEFPLQELFVIDGSKRSTKANAYFTGFGRRKRIALYDTLIERHSTEELVAVLAHEIGHFKRGHIIQRMVVSILQSGVIFLLLGLATNPDGAFARELATAFGVGQVSPHTGILFFAILFSPVSRLLGVISNWWSRRHEFEADAFARDATGDPAPLASALKKLSTDNLAHPTPHALRVALDYSHPPLVQRLAALRAK